MALWGTNSASSSDKPKWLYDGSQTTGATDGVERPKDADLKTNCTGSSSTKAWTVPAGGNSNPSAEREILVCVKTMT